MSCAVPTAPAHGIRAKPGRAPGDIAPRSGPYPEQGIQTWFVQGHVALGVARQAHTQPLSYTLGILLQILYFVAIHTLPIFLSP